MVNRVKLARHVGDLSADNFLHGAATASVFAGLPSDDVAKLLRVSVEKSHHKDNINYEEQRNVATYLRSLDKRLSIPKHRRSSADSNEDAAPLHISRNKYVQPKGTTVQSSRKKTANNSPGRPTDKHLGSLKLGEDVLKTDSVYEADAQRRLSTAMNPAADVSLDFGSKLYAQSFNDMNKTSIGFVRKSESLRRPDLISHNHMSKRRKRNYKRSVLNAISCEDRSNMLRTMQKGMN